MNKGLKLPPNVTAMIFYLNLQFFPDE